MTCKAVQASRYLQSAPPAKHKVYDSFRRFLSRVGFTLYPGEFECMYSGHPFVDIAAKMGSYYWAFEYKSEHDSISRGVEQVGCYMRWFDYVVLVTERNPDHRRSENYWKLKRMGAGIWVYDPNKDVRIVKAEPVILSPDWFSRRLVARKFRALTRSCRNRSDVSSHFQRDILTFSSA